MSQQAWQQLSSSFTEVIRSLDPSIVAIHGGGRNTATGVVWRDGIIVTARHALRRRSAIRYIHADPSNPLMAELAGSDPGTDLAVLRADTSNLKPITISAKTDQSIGELVLSVGRSRLGDLSASSGIIARLGSPWRTWAGGNIDRLLRPDVRLYVGLVGSVLVNSEGHALGINSNALARGAVITVPNATVERVVNAILQRGSVPRPYLGLSLQQVPLPESIRPHFPPNVEQALLVTGLEKGAPAEKSGVQVGDIIISLAGQPVTGVRDFHERLLAMQVGDPLALSISRAGSKIDITAHVGHRD